ncbi:MAG: SDR family oxidoreductase, partial [Acidithiobacillus sp.]
MTPMAGEADRYRVLLLGAQGQVGWELQRSQPPSVKLYALGRQDLDIRDADKLRKAVESFQPDCLINAAAYTAVDRAESEAGMAYAINRDGAAHCALAAQSCGARLIHISTDFVFDGAQSTPYQPGAPVAPLGVYGGSKAAGEQQVREILGDAALILRTAWVYSAHGSNFVK